MKLLLIAVLLAVALASCGTKTRTVTVPASSPTTSASTAKPDTAAWPRLWCRASVGMSRIALARLMGLPTEQNSHKIPLIPHTAADGSEPPEPPEPLGSDTWQAPGTYQFNAFYGGHPAALYVQQLDFNGPASALPCAPVRVQ